MTDDNSVAGGQQNNSYGAALTQDSIDVYWCIYKNLEKEVVGLTDVIHFTDDQKQVFSIRIAELIKKTYGVASCCYNKTTYSEDLISCPCFCGEGFFVVRI